MPHNCAAQERRANLQWFRLQQAGRGKVYYMHILVQNKGSNLHASGVIDCPLRNDCIFMSK